MTTDTPRTDTDLMRDAEVEKLKAQLSMAIDLADRLFPHMASAIYYMEKNDIRNKLNSLKKEIK